MAKWTVKGIDEFVVELERLAKDTTPILAKAIYKATDVVMAEVRKEIASIPTDDRTNVPKDEMRRGLRTIQVEGLKHSVGVAPLHEDGNYLNVKIGFDGYNNLRSKKYPNGQPNVMIARSIISGTSFMKKYPFMRKAESRSRKRAETAMSEELDKEIEKRTYLRK